MPPQLSPNHAGDTKVDGLTFQFLKIQNATVAIQADAPWGIRAGIPSGVEVLYYEVQVVDLEDGKSNIAVGIATPNFPLVGALPGRTRGSYAQNAPSFGKGDIVGVGLDSSSGELFFTKNGEAVGAVTTVETGNVYFPTVGTDAKSTFKFNFDGPFTYKFKDRPVPPIKIPEGKESAAAPSNEKPKGAKGHIMISYQWGSKELALQIYEALTARRFVVWMDVKGGMSGDIYQSMSEGVEGAVLFLPLITSKYTASPNCRRECSAAADQRKPIMPLLCENIKITGWLLACISGLLWTECFDNKISKDNLEHFLSEVEKAIPSDSPARQPNLSIYISYSPKDRESAEVIKRLLEEKTPPFNCVMSADEKSGPSVTTPMPGGEAGVGLKKADKQVQKSAALEEKLTNAKAVILIISNNFESSDDCRNDVSLSYSHRKLIVPIVVKKFKYPPKGMEFALKELTYLDCVATIQRPAKHSTISRRITEALSVGAVTKPAASGDQNENFLIKNAGKWTESDVSQWLNSVGLSQYASVFRAKHVNGKVLLGLQGKDLDFLHVMKLHQRRFFSSVSTLFNGLNWNEDEVAEWMEGVGLSELTQNLYKAHINGQSLLMLTESDLTANDITDPVTQKRLLAEIQQLKETEARVPPKDDLYRFKILRSVLQPIPSDAKDDTFKFAKEPLELLRHIFNKVVEADQIETKLSGLTQFSLGKFLFTLLICAGTYHDTYPTKNIWNDLNIVELLSLKHLTDGMMNQLDDFINYFDLVPQLTADMAEPLSDQEKKILCILLILNNIVQRLFAIIDRMVDGVISWNELLPSIELIVHGSTDDKFKLAMCLVDFNGDGDISRDEYLEFYKDCFRPIVNFCKVMNLANFNQLDKDSFLFVAYQKVKDGMTVGREPTLLNKDFSIKQFQGFLHDRPADIDAIFNVPWDCTPCVWFPYGYHVHELVAGNRPGFVCNACYTKKDVESHFCATCDFDLCPTCYSKRSNDPARNIDILGIYTNGTEFTVTNITFGGKFNCAPASLVKNALVWVTNERPDLAAYAKFDNFTQEQADAYEGADKPLFIVTDPAANYIAHIDLAGKPLVGKYVLIKLLNGFTEEEIGAAEEEAKQRQESQKEITNTPNAEEVAGQQKGKERENIEEGEKIEEIGEEKEGEQEVRDADAEGGPSEQNNSQLELEKKCLVTEFIGLWGYNGKNPSDAPPHESVKLFEALVAKYDDIGTTYNQRGEAEGEGKINKYVTEFLKAASDLFDGNEELSPKARDMFIDKKDVEELLRRLNFLTVVGDNPANALMLILPIIHLFRLFYGHDVMDILLKPM